MGSILFLAIFLNLVLTLPNQRPIIGVYTQEDFNDEPISGSDEVFQSYIGVSYTKFIEMSGAQVVPIFAYSNRSVI